MYSDFSFAEEFKENWNKKVKKIRWFCILLSIFMIVKDLIVYFFKPKHSML